MISSRKIDDLSPPARIRAIRFCDECAKRGIDVLIYCTYRDNEAQAALYARGRTVKGSNPRLLKPMGDIVTNAKPGESWHNWRAAFDFVPMVNGKPAWNDTKLFQQCGEVGESVGLEWAGRWRGSLRETGHMQYTGGLTIARMRAGASLESMA